MLTHQVSRVSFSEGTDVQFAELPEQVVRAYIETGEPMDKAGGYGIQVAAIGVIFGNKRFISSYPVMGN